MRKATVSIPLPGFVYDVARGIRHAGRTPQTPERDLRGDRDIEWAWVASHIPDGHGEALDFGPGGSPLALIAAGRGYAVTAVDQEPIHWPYEHEGLLFLQGDILELPLEDGRFDLIVNCSTVEHVGIVGRYGVNTARPDGDLEAMARLRRLMKAHGTMLLTIPVGRDAVFPPLHRVYGRQRLPRLLDGFTLNSEEFWLKDDRARWVRVPREDAIDEPPEERLYGLGCFVLTQA